MAITVGLKFDIPNSFSAGIRRYRKNFLSKFLIYSQTDSKTVLCLVGLLPRVYFEMAMQNAAQS